MIHALFRRTASGLAAVLLASLLAFLILESSPGDVLSTLLGDEATMEQQEQVRAQLGLDDPLHTRYLRFMGSALRGDMGVSMVSGRPVMEMIGQRFLNTLLLTSVSIMFAVSAGAAFGIWAALHYNQRADLAVLLLTALGLALPVYGLAIFLTQVFSVRLGWLPAVGGGTPLHFILPCISLATPTAAVITRVVRTRMIEELRRPYVTTAHAKGLPRQAVWRRHVLRNAINPALILVGVQFGHLLGGAFIVETMFAWPGLGRLTVQAIFDQDIPVVLGAVVLSALIFQLLNAIIDVSQQILDPRMRTDAQ